MHFFRVKKKNLATVRDDAETPLHPCAYLISSLRLPVVKISPYNRPLWVADMEALFPYGYVFCVKNKEQSLKTPIFGMLLSNNQ